MVLTSGDAGVAEALGTLPPPEEVDPAQLSPKSLMVRMRSAHQFPVPAYLGSSCGHFLSFLFYHIPPIFLLLLLLLLLLLSLMISFRFFTFLCVSFLFAGAPHVSQGERGRAEGESAEEAVVVAAADVAADANRREGTHEDGGAACRTCGGATLPRARQGGNASARQVSPSALGAFARLLYNAYMHT